MVKHIVAQGTKKLVILLDIQIFFITLYITKYSSAYDTIDTS